MTVKIKTLLIVEGEREVPLTKAIVGQLPYFDGARYTTEDKLEVIGTVETHDAIWVLVNTPDLGLTRINQSNFWGCGYKDKIPGKTERLVLLK